MAFFCPTARPIAGLIAHGCRLRRGGKKNHEAAGDEMLRLDEDQISAPLSA